MSKVSHSLTLPTFFLNNQPCRSADLSLVPGKKFTLVGTPEGDEIKDPSSRSCSSETTDSDLNLIVYFQKLNLYRTSLTTLMLTL